MNHFQKEDSFHTIMKEHMLEIPSAQLEDIVMNQIRRHRFERKIKANYIRSFIFGVLGCLLGVFVTIWMNETKAAFTEAFGSSIFLSFQVTLTLVIVTLIDFAINSLLSYRKKPFIKTW